MFETRVTTKTEVDLDAQRRSFLSIPLPFYLRHFVQIPFIYFPNHLISK